MDSQALPAVLPSAERKVLKAQLRRAERSHRLRSLALIAPLLVFLIASFVLPIGTLLERAFDDSDLPKTLPATLAVLEKWDGQALPGEAAYAALALDLRELRESGRLGIPAKRLGYEISGFRSLLNKTLRKLPASAPYKEALVAANPEWGELPYWQAIRNAAGPHTARYLLAALDREHNAAGEIVVNPESAFIDVFLRTFWIAGVVTAWCLLLGYPVAYWLSILPPGKANLLMILVLLPFWTSLLVRTAAWIVLLQSGGLLNGLLMALGFTDQPLELVFNRFGVIVAMTHILLPFMILPLYSVMKGIPPYYVRAAVSLGAHPFLAFWKVYVPQTIAGVGAGCLLTYILALGYYITPALVGGPADQMVSYFVAFYTNKTINWGMASALGALLLAATLVLYAVYGRLVAAGNPQPRR